MATIATHNGTALSQSHNQREGKASKDKHIDPTRTPQNETICHERIQDAYSRLFDASVAEYDQKQHKGRKIGNYYDKIKADKKKNLAYELIVGVYPDKDKRDFTQEQGKEILKEYFAGWKERNPHLEAVGAYYHCDEEGEPHLHIDYIPVATNCKRGPKTQTALVKALEQQGITGEKDKFVTAQMKWEARENGVLEGLCRERGIEVRHPQREAEKEAKKKHQDTPEYKQVQAELAKIQQQAVEAQKQLAEFRERVADEEKEKKAKLKGLSGDIEQLKGDFDYWNEQERLKRESADEALKQLDKIHDKQDYENSVLKKLQDKVKELKEYVGVWYRPEHCPSDDELKEVKPFFGMVLMSSRMWEGVKDLMTHFKTQTECRVMEKSQEEKQELHRLRKFYNDNKEAVNDLSTFKEAYTNVKTDLEKERKKNKDLVHEKNDLQKLVNAVKRAVPDIVQQIEKRIRQNEHEGRE